jgi:WD40 repeat protein
MFGTASKDKTARIYNLNDLENPLVLKHDDPVWDIDFSKDGSLAATSTDRGGLFIWNTKTGKPEGKPLVETNQGTWFCYLRFSPDGKRIYAASNEGKLNCWDLETRKSRSAKPFKGRIDCIDLSPDGNWLVLGRGYGRVDFIDTETLSLQMFYEGHYSGVDTIAFSVDGKQLATGSTDTNVRVWDVEKILQEIADKKAKAAKK